MAKQFADFASNYQLCKVDDYPKPVTGYVLVQYTTFASNEISTKPWRYYKIPIDVVSDQDWAMLVTLNHVFHNGELDDDWSSTDADKIEETFSLMESKLADQYKPYQIHFRESPSSNWLTNTSAFIVFGSGSY